jgi:poly(3-hydroxybutyrate) depolymerase
MSNAIAVIVAAAVVSTQAAMAWAAGPATVATASQTARPVQTMSIATSSHPSDVQPSLATVSAIARGSAP